MKLRHLGLVVLACLNLGGCVETRFASPLGDNIETCDTRWKGLWIDTRESKDKNEAAGFFVDKGCEVSVLDQTEPGGPIKRQHVPVNFVHDGSNDYLVVSDAQLKGLVEVSDVYAVSPKPEKSFYFVQYRFRGDKLELYDVNTQHVAALIVEEKLKGTVSKTDSELHAYVAGDRAQMLEVVRKQAVFNSKPGMVLERSKMSMDEYEHSLVKPPKPHKK
jgi:hypothetical protein